MLPLTQIIALRFNFHPLINNTTPLANRGGFFNENRANPSDKYFADAAQRHNFLTGEIDCGASVLKKNNRREELLPARRFPLGTPAEWQGDQSD